MSKWTISEMAIEQAHELFVVPPSGGLETTSTAKSCLKAELRTNSHPAADVIATTISEMDRQAT
jgi:hypothetical protein